MTARTAGPPSPRIRWPQSPTTLLDDDAGRDDTVGAPPTPATEPAATRRPPPRRPTVPLGVDQTAAHPGESRQTSKI